MNECVSQKISCKNTLQNTTDNFKLIFIGITFTAYDFKQWTGEGMGQLKRKAMGREEWRKNLRDWVHPRPT